MNNFHYQLMVDELVEHAREAMEDSYSPYSGYSVGAAVETSDGEVYTGANIENINYSGTLHAEGTAMAKAVHDGYTKSEDFEKMAISLSGDPVPPCGRCRQTLSEFCDEDFEIIVDGDATYTLGQLLPSSMEDIE